MSTPEESNLIKKMMQKISPVRCTQDAVKQGENCPVDAGTLTPKICCWYCENLPECVEHWPIQGKNDYRCKKYHTIRWCSAAWQAYRERGEGK